jgi:DNA transformation protein
MSDFADFLKDAFREFGPVQVRRMFGGEGVFYDGVMIGLVADDMLYLKADATSVAEFKALDLAQFQYPKGDKLVGMSYYQAPEGAMEDPSEMRTWAELAYSAALRSKKK